MCVLLAKINKSQQFKTQWRQTLLRLDAHGREQIGNVVLKAITEEKLDSNCRTGFSVVVAWKGYVPAPA